MKRTISKSERPYRLLLCVMISLLVIMLAGCSTSSDSDTNTRGFTDFATIEEEYLTTIESLNWPEGFTPPDALEGDMPYMGTDRCDDATRKYLRDNIDKAKLGDPSGFTECIQANYAD